MDGVTNVDAVVSNTGDDDDDVLVVDVVNDGGGGKLAEVNDGAALRELLKGVVVAEESYKTPKKGFSSVAISVEIEEYVQVDVGLPPPSIGMVFQSWQELNEYFREYGKQNGFGVVGTSACKVGKGPNAKMRRNCLWICECFGFPVRKRKKVEDSLVTDAQVVEDEARAVLQYGGHTLTPEKAKNISRLRKKFLMENPHVVRQLFNERRCGVPLAKIYNKMARERNGVENMPFSQKDLHDEVAKQKKRIYDEGDAKAMFTYFQTMVDDNFDFFYTYRVDEEGRLKDVLWVDSRCRMAYEEFGDVVCFDSTYLTNEYKLPFCNFVGVNHHGPCDEESSKDYNEKDYTEVVCLAYSEKILYEVGEASYYPVLKEDLESVVYDSLDCGEFERRWEEVIKKHECESDEWLEGLFLERDMWFPTYVKHLFWAGMKTTQRVESIHGFFDGYLSRHTLLSEFVKRYCEALEVRATIEKRADDNNSRFVRQPITAFPAESLFPKIYPDAKFKEFQRECTRVLYVTGLEKRQILDTLIEHVLEDIVWFKPKNSRKEVPSQRKRVYKVTYNSSTQEDECECRYFHCHGIICRHMIMVYQMNNCREIPDKYILHCWRKDVIRKHTRVKVKYHDPSKTEAVCRFDKMMGKFSPICSKASIYKSVSDVLLNGLQLLDIQVEEKLAMLSRNRSDLLGCNGTPSSVCLEKEATPPTTEKKDLSLELATIKDPPIPKNLLTVPQIRGTSHALKKLRNRERGAMEIKEQEQHLPFPMMGYSPHCVGGIQMTVGDGSLGYFNFLSRVQRPPSSGSAESPS
ncbi:protein FAR1-RELATED SEQUENCE 6-like [Chenopodium quinoa]|uniref:protein FAR1-RELATED SEQUENCE 6-like n=1 Tax=Chenopodium quinoa TaxID=63459 RepID=UPI000B77837D|nr:protein FAR1-RELATED SEQUENCE 6-like [Chenopodium quinoa]